MRRAWVVLLAAAVMAQAPAAGPAAPLSPPDTWLPRGTADLVVLDKLRAQPSTLVLRTGQVATFGTLAIALKSCAVRPPDLPANAAAFVEVTDSRDSAPAFRGWLLSTTPAVSQFEHPVYGLRLITCR